MRIDQLPPEVVELAKLHGIDLEQLPEELTDENLEAVVGGKVYVVPRGPGFWGPRWGYGPGPRFYGPYRRW